MRSYKNLWNLFISEKNIREAIRNVCKHKTTRSKFRTLKENPDKYLKWIRNEAEHFRNSPHKPIEIYDGIQRKKRTIIVPSFREQIIHHMVVNIIKPIIMKSLYEKSYGSVPGRGAHLGKKQIEKVIRRGSDIKYCLKMDVRKYFDSVPHDKLMKLVERKIKDKRFVSVIREIVNATDYGIPLGFYTSQWFANWYLSDLDHCIKERFRAKHYFRYMDDMVVFGNNKRELHRMRILIEAELRRLGLEMKGNWQVFRFDYIRNEKHRGRDLDFMGFRFYRNKVVLRRSIMYKASRKARRIAKKFKASIYEIRQMLSYLGWIDATNTYGMYQERIKPLVNFRRMKKRISNYERRRNEFRKSAGNAGNKAA